MFRCSGVFLPSFWMISWCDKHWQKTFMLTEWIPVQYLWCIVCSDRNIKSAHTNSAYEDPIYLCVLWTLIHSPRCSQRPHRWPSQRECYHHWGIIIICYWSPRNLNCTGYIKHKTNVRCVSEISKPFVSTGSTIITWHFFLSIFLERIPVWHLWHLVCPVWHTPHDHITARHRAE